MAECSYASCMQERRAVKKQLQKWTKTMICIVGLERIAEELMGKRSWKQYQDLILKTTVENDYQKVVPDWEPSDTCHLCNGPSIVPDPAVIHLPDSDSSNQSQSSFRDTSPVTLPQTHCHLSHSPDRVTMTTLESASPMSMAASLTAAAQIAVSHSGNATNPPPPIPFYSSSHRHDALFPPWYLPPSPHPATGHSLHSDGHGDSIPDASISPAAIVSVADQCMDQPLDLSAKTGDNNQNLKVPHIDHKQIFKAKPRMTTISGRKTYTEDELQAALRDIQSGKLGTRRAAVIYGIPRSTLRNKVYKLSMERERDSHLARMEDEDKELSGAEEEREVEKVLRKPMLSEEDILRVTSLEHRDSLGAVFKHVSPVMPFPFSPDLLGGVDHSTVGPFIPHILASTLLQTDPTSRLIGSRIPELVRRIIAEEKHYLQERLQKRCLGLGSDIFFPNGMHAPDVTVKGEGTLGQREEEEEQDDASCRTSSPTNVILKIPSFKPSPKNGVSPSSFEGWPRNSELSPCLDSQSTHMMTNSDSSSSSPVSISKNNALNLKDVSKSIASKFQPQADECFSPSLQHFQLQQQNLFPPNGFEQSIFRHGSYSNSLPIKHCNNNIHNNNNTNHEDHNVPKDKLPSNKMGMQQSSTGKGTRPKRGKYRNYDRDSLMEAVRAVQRGEMSVHRAGSYYGVPHSTLEYKVKERHLMRPRKREPKPQLDDGKKKEDGIKIAPVDRSRTPSSPSKFMKPFSPTSPLSSPQNGLKMPPLFDSAMPLSYNTTPPFPFWSSAAFPSLPVSEFSHNSKTISSSSNYRPPPEHFYASQMMQRLQEESSRMHPVCNSDPLLSHSLQTAISPGVLGKNAREIAESLYDGSGTGGSFLDGIIRSSLDMGMPLSREMNVAPMSNRTSLPENISGKIVTDELYHSNIKSMSHSVSSSDEESVKRTSVNILESNMISPSDVHLSPPLISHIKEEKIASDEENESHTPIISQIKMEVGEVAPSVVTRCENDETDNNNTQSVCDSEVLSRCETDAAKDGTGEDITLEN